MERYLNGTIQYTAIGTKQMKRTKEEVEAIIQELKQGLSYSQIQKKHPGLSKSTISRIKNGRTTKSEVNKPKGLNVTVCGGKQFARNLMNVVVDFQFAADKSIRVIAPKEGRGVDISKTKQILILYNELNAQEKAEIREKIKDILD